MDTQAAKQKLEDILRQHRVVFAAFFGSRAKGGASDSSDYDILIETDPKAGFSLFDHVDLKNKLEAALGAEVDLVTVGALNRHLRREVLRTMKVIYDERER